MSGHYVGFMFNAQEKLLVFYDSNFTSRYQLALFCLHEFGGRAGHGVEGCLSLLVICRRQLLSAGRAYGELIKFLLDINEEISIKILDDPPRQPPGDLSCGIFEMLTALAIINRYNILCST